MSDDQSGGGVGAGWTPFEHVVVGGMRVALASRADLAEAMAADCLAARRGAAPSARKVFDANGHGISLRASDPAFRAAVDAGDVIHADGQFVVWAAKMFARAAPAERAATTDMIHDAAERAVAHELSFFLLGGEEAVNAACAARLVELYPGLKIAGRRHGFFSAEDEPAVVAEINASGADVVWVGLGKPKEQAFCVAHAGALKAGWLVTCGGCFNYITGDYARAPNWMQSAGLEWLHRMASRPRALVWRYAVTSPHAIWLAARDSR